MTAEQRLAAFLAHCQLMTQLASAGQTMPKPRRVAVPLDANQRAGPVSAADG
jgi:hypothetical protein